MGKLKVAILNSYSADFRRIGGTQSLVRNWTNIFLAKGWKVDVYTTGAQTEEILQLKPNLRSIYCRNSYEAFKKIDKHKFNILLGVGAPLPLHILSQYYYFLKWILRRVHFIHIFHKYPPLSENPFLRWLQSGYLKCVYDVIVAVSPRIVDALKSSGINAHLMLPPIPKKFYFTKNEKIDEKQKEKLDKKVVISYIGRVSPDKGIESVIRAFKKIRNIKKVVVKIYGLYNPKITSSLNLHRYLTQENEIEYKAMNYLRNKYSEKSENDIISLLKITDIIVLPFHTLSETVDSPLLLLESMASLCIPVASDIGDIQFILQDSHLLIKKEENLYDALAYLIKENKLEEKQRHIKNRVDDLGFDIVYIGNMMFKMLKKC